LRIVISSSEEILSEAADRIAEFAYRHNLWWIRQIKMFLKIQKKIKGIKFNFNFIYRKI
jgi:hypothetical protein